MRCTARAPRAAAGLVACPGRTCCTGICCTDFRKNLLCTNHVCRPLCFTAFVIQAAVQTAVHTTLCGSLSRYISTRTPSLEACWHMHMCADHTNRCVVGSGTYSGRQRAYIMRAVKLAVLYNIPLSLQPRHQPPAAVVDAQHPVVLAVRNVEQRLSCTTVASAQGHYPDSMVQHQPDVAVQCSAVDSPQSASSAPLMTLKFFFKSNLAKTMPVACASLLKGTTSIAQLQQ